MNEIRPMTGADLKAWRLMMGLKQKDVALLFGVTVRGLAKMEHAPKLRKLVAIACLHYLLATRRADHA